MEILGYSIKKINKTTGKTIRCNLCGHIYKTWNQKSPPAPHCFPNLECPNSSTDLGMKEKQVAYYKKKYRGTI